MLPRGPPCSPLGISSSACSSPNFGLLLALWFALGLGYSLTQTPSGRLLRRSSTPEDRPALFAAQFALSHACWLIAYLAAGWLGATAGLSPTFAALGLLAVAATFAAMRLWPAHDPDEIAHHHDGLDQSSPHVAGAEGVGDGYRHAHPFVIDSRHPKWPRSV